MSEQPAMSEQSGAIQHTQNPNRAAHGGAWHVREAVAGEESVIGRIQRDAMAEVLVSVHGQDAERLVESLDADDMAEAWSQPVRSGIKPDRGVLVAEEDGHVVGFTSFHVDGRPLPEVTPAGGVNMKSGAAQLLTFEVVGAHRNRGHGSRMLSAVADTCRENGVPGLAVWIVAQDEPKLKFFQTAGFAPVGVRRSLQTPVGDVVEHLWYAEL